MKNPSPLILAADIGGTNTRVALLDGTELRLSSVKRFTNADAGSLEDILGTYLTEHDVTPDAVSLALAGPIDGETGRLTNLDWSITTEGARAASGAEICVLMNDLQAQGHALPYLPATAFTTVKPAKAAPDATTSLMIGIGTGLNIAPVHRLGARTFVGAAEAGHVTFAPTDGALEGLRESLAKTLTHVAVEDVLSGRGVERAYRHTSGQQRSAQEIMALCANNDAHALGAARLLVQTLGHYAGDMALIHLPRGGLFLVGGVARALCPYLEKLGFHEAFSDKGRFSEFMAQFSVQVVEDDYAALVGAASYAQECLGRA